MRTRSSPSLATLHSWARELGVCHYERFSKAELYRKLRRQHNLDRLLRAHARRNKRKLVTSHYHASASFQGTEHHPRRGGSSFSSLGPSLSAIFVTRAESATANVGSKKPLKEMKPEMSTTAHEPWASHSPECNGFGTCSSEINSSNKIKATNELDPIMFTELTDWTFTFVRSNGTAIKYNVDSLVDYFLHTGDFTEPETRIEFSDEDLRRLDQLAKAAGIFKQSVVEAKHSPHKYSEKRFRQDALVGLERCAGELVCEMMEVIEKIDPEEGEVRLLMTIFPMFADYFAQLEAADSEFSRQCMNHWIEYLRGPKNRPTKDYYGFLPIILDFMHKTARNPQGRPCYYGG